MHFNDDNNYRDLLNKIITFLFARRLELEILHVRHEQILELLAVDTVSKTGW